MLIVKSFQFAPLRRGIFFVVANCCYRSLRIDRARLLVAAGARQPSKKLAEVVIGNERAPAKLAGDELAGANGAVNSVAAKVGRSADFVDRICEPAFAARHAQGRKRAPPIPDNRQFQRAHPARGV